MKMTSIEQNHAGLEYRAHRDWPGDLHWAVVTSMRVDMLRFAMKHEVVRVYVLLEVAKAAGEFLVGARGNS